MKEQKQKWSPAVRWTARWAGSPWAWVPVLGLFTLAALIGLGRLESDSSNEAFMPEQDPVTLSNQEFQDQFGNQEFYFLLVRGENIFQADFLADLEALCSDLEVNLPFLREINSLTHVEMLRDREGLLETWVPYRSVKEGTLSLQDFRREVESSLLVKNRLLNGEGTAAGILISLHPVPTSFHAQIPPGYSPLDIRFLTRDSAVLKHQVSREPPGTPAEEGRTWETFRDHRKLTSATLEALVGDYRARGMDIQITGLPYIDYRIDRFIEKESARFGLVGVLAAALLLGLIYRSWRGMAGALGVFVLSLVLVLGFMGAAGMKASLLTIVLPPLILVISVSYTVHFMNQYRRTLTAGLVGREALGEAFHHTLWPSFLTMATTALGFLSFLLVPMEPIRGLGLVCAAGTAVSFLLAMVLGPAVWTGWKPKKPKAREQKSLDLEVWRKWVWGLGKYRFLILSLFAAVTLGSLWGITLIKPSSRMLEMMGPRADFSQEALSVSSLLGGAYSADFHIILPEAGMAADPEILEGVKRAGARALTMPGVTLDFSLADLVRELHRILGSGTATRELNRELVSQYLLLYEMAGGGMLADWTDLDYRQLRLSLVLGPDTGNLDETARSVKAFLIDHLPPGSQVKLAGDLPVMLRMMEMIMEGQLWSLVASLVSIFILLFLILKSFRLGILAVLANLFPLVVALGLLGLLGYPLDFVTALLAPMLLGLAVDDTIHFFTTLKAGSGGDLESPGPRAAALALEKVGWSLTTTSLVLALGFGMFILSDMASLSHLGVLAAGGILAALAGDLVLTPLLLHFPRRAESPGPEEVCERPAQKLLPEPCPLEDES